MFRNSDIPSYSLILTEDYPWIDGGIAVYAYYLASQLSRLGEKVVVLAPHTKNDAEFDGAQGEGKRLWIFLGAGEPQGVGDVCAKSDNGRENMQVFENCV